MTRKEALQAIKAKMDYYESDKRLRCAIETLIPELRESEDERTRKALIETVKCIYAGDTMFLSEQQRDRYIAWLEKQKDLDKMIVVSPEVWDNAITDAYENGKRDSEKQKEQKHYWKPTETDVALFNKAVTTNKSLTPSERAQLDIIRSKFGCCRANNCSGIMQKEQKPVETWPNLSNCIHDCKNCLAKCLYRKDENPEQKPADLSEMMVHKEPYIAPIPTPMVADEQKPAEWSKNDTVFLNEITDFFENKTVRLQHDIDMYAHWLKSLPDRFNLQPKQEWSEEDEEMLNRIIETLSLPPIYDTKACAKMVSWLKSLRPSWKPSEEQMEALLNTLHPDDPYYHDLKSLYEQLKKL